MSRTAANGTGLASSVDDPRVVVAAEEYAELLRAGNKPDRAAFLARHADVADALAKCLDGLEFVHAAGEALSRPAADGQADGADLLLAGMPVGDYQLVRELGRGGMGIVYEAEQLSLGRRVALKVLPFAATMDGKQLQRFKNEARAAAGLHHEHIVPVYGVGSERGVHYYAMQLIEGATLAEVIKNLTPQPPSLKGKGEKTVDFSPPFPLREGGPGGLGSAAPTAPVAALSTKAGGRAHYRWAAELIADAADALEYAHSVGIVHRDVKPGNLLVDGSGKAWVTDFGLARFGPDAGLTMSGDLLGTLRYMAPEQALARHGLADHRVDVYGLGCTLYELLTGCPAVAGEDKQEVLHNLAFADPVPPRKLDKAIPAELETVALKCLAKNPTERYATAGELAADLRRWLADQPIRAEPPTARQRAGKWLRRHKAVAWAAAAVGMVVLAAAAALAGLAWHKNAQLMAANADAVRDRQLARRALDDLTSQVIDDWLSRQPVIQERHRAFLQRALNYYTEFAAHEGNDEHARGGVAVANLRVGGIQKMLGRPAEAEAAYRVAITQLEALAAAHPDDPKVHARLLRAYSDLGDLLQDGRWYPEAEQTLRQAVDLGERLVAEAPDLPGYWPDLASAKVLLGTNYSFLGRSQEARDVLAQALEIGERLVAAFPSEAKYQSDLGGALNDLATCGVPDFAESDRLLTRAIQHQALALKADPGNIRYRECLCNHYLSRNKVLEKLHRAADAAQARHEAIALARRLRDELPGVPKYGHKLADLLLDEGSAHYDAGRHREAMEPMRAAAVLCRPLASTCPDVTEYQLTLARALMNLSAVAVMLTDDVTERTPERFDEWERDSREAVAVLERLAVRLPYVPEHRHNLGGALHNLAMLSVRRGDDPEKTRGLLLRAIEVQREAVAAQPQNAECREFLCYHLVDLLRAQQRVAERHLRAGRKAEAEQAWAEAGDRAEKLLAEYPNDPSAQDVVAEFLATSPDGRLRNPARAVELARKAVAVTPDDAGNRTTLGIAEFRAGHWAEAAATLEKASALSKNGGDAYGWFFLAMADWQLGRRGQAREWYAKAVEWTNKYKPTDDDLNQLRAEAAELLGVPAADKRD